VEITNLNTKPFTLVILPDTQIYTESYPDIFTKQTQWIVDNIEKLDIAFVLHEGDIQNTNTEDQWQRAYSSMSLLDGKIPYAVVKGNHDMGPGGKCEVRESPLFNQFFPVDKFSGLNTFGGTFDSTLLDNSYHLFEKANVGWLILALEYLPRDRVLEWANDITASYTDRKVILLTHSHVYRDNKLHGVEPVSTDNVGIINSPEGANNGLQTWDKLISNHHNMSLVFNGHFLDIGRFTAKGDNGNIVHQMLANYQDMEEGGSGYLRLAYFDPSNKTVQIKTYSPYLDSYLSDDSNEFTLENCNF
jgi:DNA repair exonuclease SbcCD nuclease subunit